MTLTTQLGDNLNCISGGSSFFAPMWEKIEDFLSNSVAMDNIVFRSIRGALFTVLLMLRPTRAGEPLTMSLDDVEKVSLQGDSH